MAEGEFVKITYQSNVLLHHYTLKPEKHNFILCVTDTGEFYEISPMAAEAVQRLNHHEDLQTIEMNVRQMYPSETVDILAFISQLMELGLITEIDGEKLDQRHAESPDARLQHISPKLARLLFHRFTIPILIFFLLGNGSIFIFSPSLLPAYTDLFVFDSMALNLLLYMFVTSVLLSIHELGHILAMRSYDLPVHVGIGNRLFFLVLESDLTAAWDLSLRKKNTVFLAGIYVDQALLCATLVLKIVLIDQTMIQAILSVILLDICIKTIYQCCIYMKTDVYYVLEHSTRCYNLFENGRNQLGKWIPWIKKDLSTEVFDGEERIVKLYGLFSMVGALLTIGLFAFYFIPQFVYIWQQVIPRLTYPLQDPLFWDGIVIIGQILLFLSIWCYVWIKKSCYNKS